MRRRAMILLSVALSIVFLVSGCEYDPSMYDNLKTDETGVPGVVTGTVLENTHLLAEPNEDAEIVEYLGAGDVVIITGELEDGYYPATYDDYFNGYIDASCLEIHEPEIDETQAENVITATVIDNINIRRGPGQDYELIERIGPGAVLVIVGEEENGYYPVEYNGEIGYAHHNFIEINEQPVEVTQPADPVDGPITVENNEAFAEIVTLTNESDERIASFFNSHIGDVIEFDGYIATYDYHGSYTTRYDVLVNYGDCDDPVTGPNFHFTDVSFFTDMNFDNNTPDYIGNNDEFTFTAEIVSYNELSGLVELDPISTVYRGD